MRRFIIVLLSIAAFAGLLYIQNEFPTLYRRYGIHPRYFNAALLYATLMLVLLFVKNVILGLYASRSRSSKPHLDNFSLGVHRISTIMSALIAFFSLLAVFNVDVRSLFTALSIVAAAIAIVGKEYFTGIVNGLTLMFTDVISISDYVKIGSHRGRVLNINFLYVELLDSEGRIIAVPNNQAILGDTINYSRGADSIVKIEGEIEYDRLESIEEFSACLITAAESAAEDLNPDHFDFLIEKVHHGILIFSVTMRLDSFTPEKEMGVKQAVLRSTAEYAHNRRHLSDAGRHNKFEKNI